MAALRISRKLMTTRGALGSAVALQDDDIVIPWDVIRAKLEELLRFLASALQDWVAELSRRGRSAFDVALPAAAVVAFAVVLCCCCGHFAATCGRRRPRGPDGEEAGGWDGPVVRCGGRGGGGYKGGIFSMHPNKPIR